MYTLSKDGVLLFLDQASYFFIPQVKTAYVNFVNHCYVDTEVEMKEIYTSNHIWNLFDNFLVDMASVRLKHRFNVLRCCLCTFLMK